MIYTDKNLNYRNIRHRIDKCLDIINYPFFVELFADNWAFLYAQKLALKLELQLHVCFCLVPKFLGATYRQFGFMLKGLKEVERVCELQCSITVWQKLLTKETVVISE